MPGLATLGKETEHARLTTGRLLVSGMAGWRGRVDAQLAASLLYERVHFENPLGEEVGPFGPSVTDGEAITASLAPKVDIPVGKLQLWTATGEAKLEHRQPYDLLKPSQALRPALRGLFALAAADELMLWRDRLSIYLGLRFDARASALLYAPSGTTLPDQDRFDWFLSPRANIKLHVNSLLTLRASAGRYVRFPTLLEQFGDGAFVLGLPTLRPESSWGGELGATMRAEQRRVRGGFEVTGFGRRTSDLIAFVPGGNTVSPENVGDAQVLGLEARGDLSIVQHVELSASYTFLDARDETDGAPSQGHLLPGRAPHAFDARVSVLGGPFKLTYELDYLSAVPRDVLGLNELPARVLHALVASFRWTRFEFVLEVRNLADTRIVQLPLGGSARAGETTPYPLVDFYNFPLPGRAFYATARIAQ